MLTIHKLSSVKFTRLRYFVLTRMQMTKSINLGFIFNPQPSMDVFKGMLHDLDIGRENSDGADQGFLVGCYPDLLDKPMFHPPENGTKLNGTYRLPLGYQMDASYYCECHSCIASRPTHLHVAIASLDFNHPSDGTLQISSCIGMSRVGQTV